MFRVPLFHSQARPVAAGLLPRLNSQMKNLWPHLSHKSVMHCSPLHACEHQILIAYGLS